MDPLTLAYFRKLRPDYDGVSDDEIAQIFGEPAVEPQRSFPRAVGDVATKFISGIPTAAGQVAGLAAMVPGPTQEFFDGSAQMNQQWAKQIDQALLSSYQQRKDQELGQAMAGGEGFLDSAGEAGKFLASNPGQVVPLVAQSIPGMLMGGGIGAGLRAGAGQVGLKMSAGTAAALGEGSLIAGGVSADVAQQNPNDPYARYWGIPAGIGGAAVARFGGRLMGHNDIDETMLRAVMGERVAAGQSLDLLESMPKRVARGFISEGLIEEAPQSMLERAMTNIGTNQPWEQGLGAEAVTGAVTGGAMGGSMGLRRTPNSYTMQERDSAQALLSDGSVPLTDRLAAATFLNQIVDSNRPKDLLAQVGMAYTQDEAQHRSASIERNVASAPTQQLELGLPDAPGIDHYAGMDARGAVNPYFVGGRQGVEVDPTHGQQDMFSPAEVYAPHQAAGPAVAPAVAPQMGTRGQQLHAQLVDMRDQGVIGDEQFNEDSGLLQQRKFKAVESRVKKYAADAALTQATEPGTGVPPANAAEQALQQQVAVQKPTEAQAQAQAQGAVTPQGPTRFADMSPADRALVARYMGYDAEGKPTAGAGMSARQIAKTIQSSHTAVTNRLRQLGYTEDFKTTELLRQVDAEFGETLPQDTDTAEDTSPVLSDEHAADGYTAGEDNRDGNPGRGVISSVGGSQSDIGSGAGWQKLAAANVPLHDARWTEDRLQEAYIGLSADPKRHKVTLDKLRGEVLRRQATSTGGSDAQALWEDHHPDLLWNNTAGEEASANGLGPKQRAKVEKVAERSASGALDDEGVKTELQKIADSVAMGTSYAEGELTKNPSSVDKIRAVIDKAFFTPARARGLVEVYATQDEAAAHYADQLSQAKGKVQAFVTQDGKIVMIAGNIAEGHELATFLHEAGVHIGMEKLIGTANFKWLTQQVEQWAKRDDGSLESRVAKQALARAENSSSKDQRAEIVAYMVEGLVDAGVTPQAAGQTEAHRWFRKLWAAAKVALRRLGFKNPDQLTGQNLVDLAYGAADLELRGKAGVSNIEASAEDTQFSQGENNDLDFTQPSSTIELRKRGTPTPKGIARAKKLYGGAEGYARYDEAAKEFFDYVKPWVDRTALKGRTDVQAFVQRLRVASDAYYERYTREGDGGEAATGGRVRSEAPGIGGLGGYSTVFDDSEESPALIVVTDDQIARAKKEAAEYGLKASDVLHAQGETLRLVMHDDGELVIYGPRADTEYFQALKDEGLADVCRDADGNILYLADGVPWTRLTKATFTELIPLLADMHARIRLYTGREHTGVWWRRATGATGNGGMNPMNERSGAVYFSEVSPTANDQGGSNGKQTRTEETRVSARQGQQEGSQEGRLQAGLLKGQQVAQQMVDYLPEAAREPALQTMAALRTASSKAFNYSIFTNDLVALADKYMPSARQWFDEISKRDVARVKKEAQVDDIATAFDQLERSQFSRTWTLIQDMTMQRKWGYAPTWKEGVTPDAALKARYDALTAPEKALIDRVFKHGEDTQQEIQRVLNATLDYETEQRRKEAKTPKDLREVEADRKRFQRVLETKLTVAEGPYAPMRRVGNHVVVAKSQRYADAERAGQSLSELRVDPNHYFVAFTHSQAEAEALARRLAAKGFPASHITAREKLKYFDSMDGLPFESINRIRTALGSEDNPVRASMMKLLNELYLTSLADTSARKSELHAEMIAGMNSDSMYAAFLSKGKADAHYLGTLTSSKAISEAMQEMIDQNSKNHDDTSMRMLNELRSRYENSARYVESPLVQKAMAFNSFWHLLTKPAYFFYNATQPFLMTLPHLVQRFGNYGRASEALLQAYRDYNAFKGTDLHKLPADVRQAILSLRDMGKIDITIVQDLGARIHNRNDNAANRGINTLDQKFKSFAARVEMMNRVVTGIAAYRLAMEKHKGNTANALRDAARAIDLTQGDYTNFNAPRLFNGSSTARLLTQFRKFQLIQLTYMAKMFNEAFLGGAASAADRTLARQAFMYMLGHHALLGGLLGLPAANAVALLFAATGGDDEPRDLELELRKALGDKFMADLLTKGVPAAVFNTDISGNVGAGQMLSIMPYTSIDFTGRNAAMKTMFGLLGPTGGNLAQMADAAEFFHQGDYYRGLESMLPSGLRAAMKGLRESTQGVQNRGGDTLTPAAEVDLLATALTMAGFKTMDTATRQMVNGKKIEFDAFYTDRSKVLKHEYVTAYKEGDAGALQRVREDWQHMNAAQRLLGFQPTPMSSLFKAPIEQRKRERETVGGVQYRKKDQGFVKQYAVD